MNLVATTSEPSRVAARGALREKFHLDASVPAVCFSQIHLSGCALAHFS
jgi:hypothetical protein